MGGDLDGGSTTIHSKAILGLIGLGLGKKASPPGALCGAENPFAILRMVIS